MFQYRQYFSKIIDASLLNKIFYKSIGVYVQIITNMHTFLYSVQNFRLTELGGGGRGKPATGALI